MKKIFLLILIFPILLFSLTPPASECNGYWEEWPNSPFISSNFGNAAPVFSYSVNSYTWAIAVYTSNGNHPYYNEPVVIATIHVYTCVGCTDPDTEFPQLDINDTVTDSWKTSEIYGIQKTLACEQSGGIVQVRTMDCQGLSRCVVDNICKEPNTDFPSLSDNQAVAFAWKTPQDRSAECSVLPRSEQQQRKIDCQDEFRCLVQSCKVEEDESISSYVSPRDGVFHEDIAVTGTDFSLHYSSANLDDDSLAHGWHISAHTKLVEGKIYSGGSVYAVTQSRQEENLTVVSYGAEEMLFDAQGKLQSTRDLKLAPIFKQHAKITFYT